MRNGLATSWRLWAAPLASVLLLSGFAYSVQLRQPPQDALRYRERVRERARALPELIGRWYGERTEVPAPAINLLKPNVMISRRYENVRSGRSVTVLFVHTRDAANMRFHHPPVCYRYNGWSEQGKTTRTWRAGDRRIPLTEYTFQRRSLGNRERVTVANFMVLPGGLSAGMDAVHEHADDPAGRMYGAAQIQVVFDAALPPERRRQIFETLMEAHLPLIRQIKEGRKSP